MFQLLERVISCALVHLSNNENDLAYNKFSNVSSYLSICLFISFASNPANIICSKSTIETLQKVCNMFKINKKNTRTTPLTLWCLYCYVGTHFTLFLVLLSLTLSIDLFAGNILLFNLI